MAYEISRVEGKLTDLFNKTFNHGQSEGFIRVNGTLVREYYKRLIDEIENFEVRDDDIWVCAFPKSGTTWTQEMVWCIANDLDFEQAKKPLEERFPFFEVAGVIDLAKYHSKNNDPNSPGSMKNRISFIRALPSPRFIKTHLPFDLLPRQIRRSEKKPKIIYVLRNPKDACISYYHHNLILSDFSGNFNEHCALFIADKVPYAPYWNNVLRYWKRRFDNNILINTYEDMKKDLPQVIQKTANFLGKNLTRDQILALTKHLSFENMKNNPAVNYQHVLDNTLGNPNLGVKRTFMRSGNADQWKTDMPPEYIKLCDDWTCKNLNGTDLYPAEDDAGIYSYDIGKLSGQSS